MSLKSVQVDYANGRIAILLEPNWTTFGRE